MWVLDNNNKSTTNNIIIMMNTINKWVYINIHIYVHTDTQTLSWRSTSRYITILIIASLA